VNDVRRLTLAEIGPRTFEVVESGMCYRLNAPGANVTIEIDRLMWRNQELAGELIVRCDLRGTDAHDGVLSLAQFNVSSAHARTQRANLLKAASRAADIPWTALLEQFCQQVLIAERTGETATPLRDFDKPDPDQRFLRVSGFVLPAKHPAAIFGDGGTAKSLNALYLGGLLCQEGYRVLLADWELEGEDHRERYEQLFGAEMPPQLFYKNCRRPLIYEADHLKRQIRHVGADYVICDSVGYASHGKPEDAEVALAYFRAVRTFGVGTLHIAHINRQESGDQKPFGSAFWHNSVRASYNVQAKEDHDRLVIAVYDRKANLTKKQPPFGLAVEFGTERTTITRCDLANVEGFAEKLSVRQRMQSLLKRGSLPVAEIAEELGIPLNTVTVTVKRGADGDRRWLTKLPGPDGVHRIGLLAR
jgi:hypothetical protein